MCGIGGTLRFSHCRCVLRPVDFDLLSHRGPQQRSSFRSASGALELAFHRLSIVDLSHAGMQPFVHETAASDDGWAVMCNGELYNAEELRSQLDWAFSSHSDCEVIIPAVLRWGVQGLARRLVGQFAFVAANYCPSSGALKRAWLCRDSFGIKPLHVAQLCPHVVMFASEAKAIPCTSSTRELIEGHVMEVSELEPGKVLLKETSWREQQLPWRALQLSSPLKHAQIAAALKDAVVRRLHGDVPIGVFLSGGVDSSLIAAIAAKELRGRGQQLHTFTVYHADSIDTGLTDAHYARQVARFIGSIHHELAFTSAEALQALPEVVRALETDDVITVRAAVPLFLLSKFVSKECGFRAVLVGEGADELFAGYSLFSEFDSLSLDAFQAEVARRLSLIGDSELLRVDRSTMAWGLEARVPFLDLDLVSLCMDASIAEEKLSHPSLGKIEKNLLRECFGDQNLLPDAVLWRRKEQFADGVGRKWLQELEKFALVSAGSEQALFTRLLVAKLGEPALDLVRARSQRRRTTALNAASPSCALTHLLTTFISSFLVVTFLSFPFIQF